MKAPEYDRYLDRLADLVQSELVPKVAVFDYFTRHIYKTEAEPCKVEPMIWFLQSGLHYDVTLSLSRLFDETNSDYNIVHFINFAESHRDAIAWNRPADVNDDFFSKQRGALATVEPLVAKLRRRRNKFFAHYDGKYFFDPATLDRDYPLTNEDAIELVRVLQGVVSAHSFAFRSGGVLSMEGAFYAAAERLFNQMRDADK